MKQIEKWNLLESGTDGLIELIGKHWRFAEEGYFKYKKGKRKFKLELHTAGWSGNEDIIRALGKNSFWDIFWMKSERGGHFYFEGKQIPKGENKMKPKTFKFTVEVEAETDANLNTRNKLKKHIIKI